jgi:Alcohol dehydrogenase GroES-like domain
MSKNRGVVYVKPGLVEVRDIAYPKFEDPHGRKINHAVILKIVSTNICGSDQHMVRGRTTAPAGLVLGHEITGEVIARLRSEFLCVFGAMKQAANSRLLPQGTMKPWDMSSQAGQSSNWKGRR